jgi:Domain of unknown function (DUF4337)
VANEPKSENELLREEVAAQQRQAAEREAREAEGETLKNRVSVAAIVLTTALSFIGNVKSDRNDAVGSAKGAADAARRQSAELWAYYQTAVSSRATLEVARDRIDLDLGKRGLSPSNPEAKHDALKQVEYQERVRDFDRQTQQVFFRVQELEAQEDVQQRKAIEPAAAGVRYELGGKLITLALILLSVTILSSKKWLLWAGVALGCVGLLVAFDGYFLFF